MSEIGTGNMQARDTEQAGHLTGTTTAPYGEPVPPGTGGFGTAAAPGPGGAGTPGPGGATGVVGGGGTAGTPGSGAVGGAADTAPRPRPMESAFLRPQADSAATALAAFGQPDAAASAAAPAGTAAAPVPPAGFGGHHRPAAPPQQQPLAQQPPDPRADAYGRPGAPAPHDDELAVLSAPAFATDPAAGFAGPPPAAVVRGRVQIEDEVVEKVAGLAAVDVDGVADLGGNMARALESVREHAGIGHKRATQGVRARIEDRQVSIHVVLVIEYGAVVMDVARAVKANVAGAVSHMLGLRVVEVNVTVDDVAMPQRVRPGAHAADIEVSEDTQPPVS